MVVISGTLRIVLVRGYGNSALVRSNAILTKIFLIWEENTVRIDLPLILASPNTHKGIVARWTTTSLVSSLMEKSEG